MRGHSSIWTSRVKGPMDGFTSVLRIDNPFVTISQYPEAQLRGALSVVINRLNSCHRCALSPTAVAIAVVAREIGGRDVQPQAVSCAKAVGTRPHIDFEAIERVRSQKRR